MRVDHFSSRTGGGAGAGARRLHEALLEAGVDSRFWYWRKGRPTPRASARVVLWGDGPWALRAASRLGGRVRRRAIKSELRAQRQGAPPGLELFTPPTVGWATPFSRGRFSGQVAHLHWVAGLIDHPTFFGSLPQGHPVVWTLRDMNPFTGGCHFSNGCERFTEGCGSCPQLGRPSPDDLSRRYLEVKRAALRGVNLHVVAPSRWMLEYARRSPVFEDAQSFRRIPTGVETDVFQPQDKESARNALGVPPERLVVAFGSERLDNVRKGLTLGLKALGQLGTERPVQVLCFGEELPKDTLPDGLPVHSLGYISDPDVLARAYSAADCFVLPSLEDNLPKTGLEALACGTPVVAFNAGGIPDFVIPGETGLLAETGDTESLARQIDWMVEHDEERVAMGQRAREFVLERFRAEGQAMAYQDLYESLCR